MNTIQRLRHRLGKHPLLKPIEPVKVETIASPQCQRTANRIARAHRQAKYREAARNE